MRDPRLRRFEDRTRVSAPQSGPSRCWYATDPYGSGERENATPIGLVWPHALRRITGRDRRCRPAWASDLSVDSTAADPGGAEDAQPGPQGFSEESRIHYRSAAAV